MRYLALSLTVLFLAACSGGTFLIPKKDYQQQVKTLGVLPLLVDHGTSIQHPQRDEIFKLLDRHSAGKEQKLVELLRASKAYFDIRSLAGNPDHLFRQLISGSELVGDGGALYRSYRFNPAGTSVLARDVVVDALLVVVLNGLDKVETRRDRNLVDYLEASFNSIQASAYIVLPDGKVVWEYPGSGSEKFLDLQYPDFDEAYHNKTDEVRVKFISVPGLDRTLGEQAGGVFSRGTYPKPYNDLFKGISAALKPGLIPGF
jgi:hypothetical protein